MDVSYYFSKAVYKFIKTPETRWSLQSKFPKAFFMPHMKPEEYKLFKQLCQKRKVFLEYGSGGSTIYLLKNNKTVYSVESNPAFYSYMNAIGLVRRSLDRNLHYQFINLGETNKWGKPISLPDGNDWSEYYEEIWKQVDPANTKVDTIFIDGRFRVCCCLYSILKLVEYNWDDTLIIIHDFWRRKQYHVILDFLDEVISSRNLAAFKLKKGIDVNTIKEKLQEYALVTQ